MMVIMTSLAISIFWHVARRTREKSLQCLEKEKMTKSILNNSVKEAIAEEKDKEHKSPFL